MMEQQKEHESELRKQSAVVLQAAQKLQEERNRKLAAYDDVEKLQVIFSEVTSYRLKLAFQLKLDESRCVQSSLGNYSPRGLATPVKLASRPKKGTNVFMQLFTVTLGTLIKECHSWRITSKLTVTSSEKEAFNPTKLYFLAYSLFHT